MKELDLPVWLQKLAALLTNTLSELRSNCLCGFSLSGEAASFQGSFFSQNFLPEVREMAQRRVKTVYSLGLMKSVLLLLELESSLHD
eukprot:m.130464 g.130464  ORF g.130464 m.130464 type:complete len:87 (+) comp38028_c0_seq2:788-1048(+)